MIMVTAIATHHDRRSCIAMHLQGVRMYPRMMAVANARVVRMARGHRQAGAEPTPSAS